VYIQNQAQKRSCSLQSRFVKKWTLSALIGNWTHFTFFVLHEIRERTLLREDLNLVHLIKFMTVMFSPVPFREKLDAFSASILDTFELLHILFSMIFVNEHAYCEDLNLNKIHELTFYSTKLMLLSL